MLVKNWKEVAKGSHSMWAVYLGLICLWVPDVLFFFLNTDTNPRLWFILANILLFYGAFGRVWDQGIDKK